MANNLAHLLVQVIRSEDNYPIELNGPAADSVTPVAGEIRVFYMGPLQVLGDNADGMGAPDQFPIDGPAFQSCLRVGFTEL